MAPSQWQPAISLFMSLYCNPPIAHDMNDVQCANGRPHHRGNFPNSFPTGVWLLLRPLRFDQRKNDEGDKANGLTSTPNDAIILTETRCQITASLISLSGWGLNQRPPSRRTGALATKLKARRRAVVTPFSKCPPPN